MAPCGDKPRDNQTPGQPAPHPAEQSIRLEARASDQARVHLAGRDLHLHYHDGVRSVRRNETSTIAHECPYPGLVSFEVEQARWFFGRDQLAAELISRLDARLSTGGLQVVVAPSGAGKSSLLHAGLLPKLSDGVLPGSGRWPQVVCTPTAQPLQVLATQIGALTATDPRSLVEQLMTDSKRAGAAPRGRIRGLSPHSRLVMVVDQFEELFTMCPDDRQRRVFIELLTQIATPQALDEPNPRPVGLVVLGVRADFYGTCVNYPRLRTAMQDNPLVVGPMSDTELREAILYPARAAGLNVEPGLVELLLRDLGDTPESGNGSLGYEAGRLPLLAHALRATWQERHGHTLTVEGYRNTGGIRRAVATTADQVLGSLTPAGQHIARILFLQLIKIGGGTEHTRRRVDRDRLVRESTEPRIAEAILDLLVRARLVSLDETTAEITHEALLWAWPRLRDWIDTDRAGLLVRQQLIDAAEAWDREGRHPSALYQGPRLAAVRDWSYISSHGTELPSLARDFVNASLQHEQDEQCTKRRRTRRLWQLVAGLTVMLVIAATTTVIAVNAQQNAAQQRNEALSRKVASEATALRSVNPALSAQLSLAAFNLAPTAETRGNLLSTVAAPYVTQLTGHTNDVYSVTFSPERRLLATASTDKSARLWEVTDPRHLRELAIITGHTEPVISVAFSPDGRSLATASVDKTVRLWDVADARHPRELAALIGHTDTVYAVAFSPDGRTVATASVDKTVRLWDVADARHPCELAALIGHTDTVYDVAFSPDGRSLATASVDKTVRLWEVADAPHPRELAALIGHTDTVYAVAFSPDGRTVATASEDATARLWEVTAPHRTGELAILTGHTNAVYAVVFSPNGQTLATAGADNVVQLWNVTDRDHVGELATLTGHTMAVYEVAFSPDGRILATTGLDRTVRLWNVTGPTLTGHTDAVYTVAFSPDGRTLATGSEDATVRLWDVTDPHRTGELTTLTGHTNAVYAVAFSPNGGLLATASYDNTVRLWDVTNPRRVGELATLTGHIAPVSAVAFSSDGRTLATGNEDAAVRLWDVTNPSRVRELATLTGHTAPVYAVVFSPDGRTLATGSEDATVRLWDVTNPSRVRGLVSLTDHTSAISAVAFSPNGRLLATASYDNTVRLLDVTQVRYPHTLAILAGHDFSVPTLAFSPDSHTLATGTADATVRLRDITDPQHPSELATLRGHTLAVYAVAFSPDRHTLATAGLDKTARLWETDVERVGAWACNIAQPSITRAEWEKFFPDLEYNPPCT